MTAAGRHVIAELVGCDVKLLSDVPALRRLLEEAAWAVGAIGIGYDQARDRILVEASELQEEDAGEEAATARFLISRAQAAGFVVRAQVLIQGSRPICPFCTRPIDPGGHVCPRSNGHVVH